MAAQPEDEEGVGFSLKKERNSNEKLERRDAARSAMRAAVAVVVAVAAVAAATGVSSDDLTRVTNGFNTGFNDGESVGACAADLLPLLAHAVCRGEAPMVANGAIKKVDKEVADKVAHGEAPSHHAGESMTPMTPHEAAPGLPTPPSPPPVASSAAPKSDKERFNYASFDCGALIRAANPEASSPTAILSNSKDVYMLNQCSALKFVEIELCEEILADSLVLANLEFFSSMFKTFRAFVTDRYPPKKDPGWRLIGSFAAKNVRVPQTFKIENPAFWAKFLRIEFVSHYGHEFYCPLTFIRVFGTSMIEDVKAASDDEYDDQAAAITVAAYAAAPTATTPDNGLPAPPSQDPASSSHSLSEPAIPQISTILTPASSEFATAPVSHATPGASSHSLQPPLHPADTSASSSHSSVPPAASSSRDRTDTSPLSDAVSDNDAVILPNLVPAASHAQPSQPASERILDQSSGGSSSNSIGIPGSDHLSAQQHDPNAPHSPSRADVGASAQDPRSDPFAQAAAASNIDRLLAYRVDHAIQNQGPRLDKPPLMSDSQVLPSDQTDPIGASPLSSSSSTPSPSEQAVPPPNPSGIANAGAHIAPHSLTPVTPDTTTTVPLLATFATPPTPTHPIGKESIFKNIIKRLIAIEKNMTTHIKTVEDHAHKVRDTLTDDIQTLIRRVDSQFTNCESVFDTKFATMMEIHTGQLASELLRLDTLVKELNEKLRVADKLTEHLDEQINRGILANIPAILLVFVAKLVLDRFVMLVWYVMRRFGRARASRQSQGKRDGGGSDGQGREYKRWFEHQLQLLNFLKDRGDWHDRVRYGPAASVTTIVDADERASAFYVDDDHSSDSRDGIQQSIDPNGECAAYAHTTNNDDDDVGVVQSFSAAKANMDGVSCTRRASLDRLNGYVPRVLFPEAIMTTSPVTKSVVGVTGRRPLTPPTLAPALAYAAGASSTMRSPDHLVLPELLSEGNNSSDDGDSYTHTSGPLGNAVHRQRFDTGGGESGGGGPLGRPALTYAHLQPKSSKAAPSPSLASPMTRQIPTHHNHQQKQQQRDTGPNSQPELPYQGTPVSQPAMSHSNQEGVLPATAATPSRRRRKPRRRRTIPHSPD